MGAQNCQASISEAGTGERQKWGTSTTVALLSMYRNIIVGI